MRASATLDEMPWAFFRTGRGTHASPRRRNYSERSRLPILFPIRESNRLRAAFPDAVCHMLAAVGVPAADVELERSQMLEIAYGRTKNRSVLGTLNDMCFGARVHFITDRHDFLEDVALRLAETPILPLDGACPIDLTRGLFGV